VFWPKYLVLVQNNIVLISLKVKIKKSSDDLSFVYYRSSSSLKILRRLVLLPPYKTEITLISFPNRTMNVPLTPCMLYSYVEKNKNFFATLKALLQEAKTYAPTSQAC
jgi:hypothetical protein